MSREGERERTADDASRGTLTMPKPSLQNDSGQAWEEPACGPGGIRRIGGASPVQALDVERGKLRPRHRERGSRWLSRAQKGDLQAAKSARSRVP